nr:MetaGeneMark_Unknown Function [uncultured bacterium]
MSVTVCNKGSCGTYLGLSGRVQCHYFLGISGALQPSWDSHHFITTAHDLGPFNAYWPEQELTPSADTYLPLVIGGQVQGDTPTVTAISMPALTPAATEPVHGPRSCAGNLYNCSDLSTQDQAQACFKFCVGQGAGDIHWLD